MGSRSRSRSPRRRRRSLSKENRKLRRRLDRLRRHNKRTLSSHRDSRSRSRHRESEVRDRHPPSEMGSRDTQSRCSIVDVDGLSSCEAASNLSGAEGSYPPSRAASSSRHHGREPNVAISLYSRKSVPEISASERNAISRTDGRNPGYSASIASEPQLTKPAFKVDDKDEGALILLDDSGLSQEIRDILGPDPNKPTKSDFNLHSALEPIWSHILVFGLLKEESDKLFSKYDLPGNCKLLNPPKINAEVEASMNAFHKLRDDTHYQYQAQLGKAISALGSAMNTLLEVEDTFTKSVREKLLSNVSDTGRMLCKISNGMTIKRRQLIAPLMNKQISNMVENVPPGEFLFGPDLGEKVQALKAMEKLNKEIRPSQSATHIQSSSNTPFRSQNKTAGGAKSHSVTSHQLNRRRPAHPRREMRSQRGRPSNQQRFQNYRQR